MNRLALTLRCAAGTQAAGLDFARHLARTVQAGAWAVAEVEAWPGTEDISVDVDGDRVKLDVLLPDANAVCVQAMRSIFDWPVSMPRQCPEALVDLAGPGQGDAASRFQERLGFWQRSGRVELPEQWSREEPLTVRIEFAAPLSVEQRNAWEDDLRALEDVLARAAFLACEPDRYAAVGATQLVWLGASNAQYWLEAVATDADWPTLLCNQLFARGPSATARTVRFSHE